jgi:hypothetical protein
MQCVGKCSREARKARIDPHRAKQKSASKKCRETLDLRLQCVEDRLRSKMKPRVEAPLQILVVALALCGIASAHSVQEPDAKAHTGKSDPTSRVTIEVSGGEKDGPVENASVYLKYVQERKLKKNKKVELNVKTNREGTAHIPEAPTGRVLIQVVADGWKTYGRWYDITDAKQTIKVHLERPPKWY